MSDDIDWISITVLGSAYEQEISECGRFQRHRLRSPATLIRAPGGAGLGYAYDDGVWQPGPAPDGSGQGNPPKAVFVNLADIIDPDDASGRTYRQVNAAKAHSIPLGTLVETNRGARLFVARHDRDCDQTPLYALSYEPGESGSLHNLSGGWSEDLIRPVPQLGEPAAWQRHDDRLGWTMVDASHAKKLAAGGVKVRPLYP